MKLFQKRWVAWCVCACMIVSALLIGQIKERRSAYVPSNETEAEAWAWEHYTAYEHYILDEEEVLSERSKKELSIYNAASDYTYDVVCALWITDTWDPASDFIADARQTLSLSENDLLLILDLEEDVWHLVPIDADSVPDLHALDLLAAEAAGSSGFSEDYQLLKFYSELSTWYQDNLTPMNYTGHVLQVVKVIGKTAGGILLVALLLAAAVVTLIVLAVISLFRKSKAERVISANPQKEAGVQNTQRASDRIKHSKSSRYASTLHQEQEDKKS